MFGFVVRRNASWNWILFLLSFSAFCLLRIWRFGSRVRWRGCIAHRECRGQSHHAPFCRCAWTIRESRLVHRARRQTRSNARADPGPSRQWRSAAWESWSAVGAADPRKLATDRDERFVTISHHRYHLPLPSLQTAESCREGHSRSWDNNLRSSLATMSECAHEETQNIPDVLVSSRYLCFLYLL